MEDSEFRQQCDQALESLFAALSRAADTHGFDVDRNAGAITVDFEGGVRFVISPNAPVRQIWVSAMNRSHKLGWDPARSAFVQADSGLTLRQLLSDVISRQLGEPVSL